MTGKGGLAPPTPPNVSLFVQTRTDDDDDDKNDGEIMSNTQSNKPGQSGNFWQDLAVHMESMLPARHAPGTPPGKRGVVIEQQKSETYIDMVDLIEMFRQEQND